MDSTAIQIDSSTSGPVHDNKEGGGVEVNGNKSTGPLLGTGFLLCAADMET